MQNRILTNSRISRFIYEIMSYNVKVEYVKGVTNIFADLLSRLPRNEELKMILDYWERKECVIMRVNWHSEMNFASKFRNIVRLQQQDPALSEIRKSEPSIGEQGNPKYTLQGGIERLLIRAPAGTKGVDALWYICVPPLFCQYCSNEVVQISAHQPICGIATSCP